MALKKYVVLDKKSGETPLECIHIWKELNPKYARLAACYAGRLDPMASGKLLILLGDECKQRDAYLGLDKEYEVEVVLGVSTDTGDALGLSDMGVQLVPRISKASVQEALRSLRGTHAVHYPSFSSKTVNGVPLFMHALRGTLHACDIPKHDETIYDISILDIHRITANELRLLIKSKLSHVPRSDEPSKEAGADFRQDEIRSRWSKLLNENTDAVFTVCKLRVTCGSGTYMRTLAQRLGATLQTQGFALSIHRTKIGRYVSFGVFSFWQKQF